MSISDNQQTQQNTKKSNQSAVNQALANARQFSGAGQAPPAPPRRKQEDRGSEGFGVDRDSGRSKRADGSLVGQTPRAQAERNIKRRAKNKKKEAVDTGPSVSDQIKQIGLDLMQGKGGRFTPERIAGMKSELHQSTFGRVKRMQRDAEAAAARRGIFRSGMSLRMQGDISRDAMQAYSKGVREIMMKKIDAEHEDKIKGAEMSQKWLSDKRNYELGKERNAIARQQIGATMAAAAMSAKVGMAGIRAANGRASASLAEGARQFNIQAGFQAANQAQNYSPGGTDFRTSPFGG